MTKKAGANAAVEAERILTEEGALKGIAEHGAAFTDDRESVATHAARVLDEIITRKPETTVALIDRFVAGLLSSNPRVVQTSANALPALAKVAPARVARHLDTLAQTWERAGDTAKDGIVRTFTALCAASVAYQKRLEPGLTRALREAEPKMLSRWTETVLPALKGEPHARARAEVESRLAGSMPRPIAQKIADYLGVKLRPAQK
jgi:hypothetical protein